MTPSASESCCVNINAVLTPVVGTVQYSTVQYSVNINAVLTPVVGINNQLGLLQLAAVCTAFAALPAAVIGTLLIIAGRSCA